MLPVCRTVERRFPQHMSITPSWYPTKTYDTKLCDDFRGSLQQCFIFCFSHWQPTVGTWKMISDLSYLRHIKINIHILSPKTSFPFRWHPISEMAKVNIKQSMARWVPSSETWRRVDRQKVNVRRKELHPSSRAKSKPRQQEESLFVSGSLLRSAN